jgi:hypothetical protein
MEEEEERECEASRETGALQLGTGRHIMNVSSPTALFPVNFEESFFLRKRGASYN